MIKIGDYIEGYEEIPDKRILRIHKTRIVVQHININNGESIYYGKADDEHCGERLGCISDKLGPVRVVTEDIPFDNNWWEKEDTQYKYYYTKDWNMGDVVEKSNGHLCKVLIVGINKETCGQVVIYKDLHSDNKLCIEPREIFEHTLV